MKMTWKISQIRYCKIYFQTFYSGILFNSPGLSKANVTVSALSSHLKVTMSSFPAHFRILDSVPVSIPIVMFLSHLKGSNPSALSARDTKLTWLLSMACMLTPLLEQSQFAEGTRSLIPSKSFLSKLPCISLASNMVLNRPGILRRL